VPKVAVVEHIPQGLPPLTVGRWTPLGAPLADMLVVCVTITLVGLMESIAIAKSLADQHRHELDPSQELLGAPCLSSNPGRVSQSGSGSKSRLGWDGVSGVLSGLRV
jgi:hypothetical protein